MLAFWACNYDNNIDTIPDKLADKRLVHQFLNYEGSNAGVEQMIRDLLARHQRTPFILDIISNYGFPSWENAFIIRNERSGVISDSVNTENERNQNDLISKEYKQIIVPIVNNDTIKSVMVFVPRQGESNLYQVHSKRVLDRIGNERRFEQGELTLGALFLRFENQMFNREEVKIGRGTFSLRKQLALASSVYFVWMHDCTHYLWTPDPNSTIWGPDAEPIEDVECDWILVQITTTSEPIPDGPDVPQMIWVGQVGYLMIQTLKLIPLILVKLQQLK